ncbi:MAG: cation:proton antiporter family protein, partial [Gammaproteobacteria bacterium]
MEALLDNIFYQIAALLILSAAVGAVGTLFRQPLVVSFILVGILAGPSVFGLVQSSEPVELLAELGIALLLFMVGLKLDLKMIRTMGLVSLTTGLGQVLFTAIVGFFICLALGLNTLTSIYVAVALTFSSTIIIVKLLSDKREIDSLHGRIALGFLIVQDLVVVLAMVVLSAFGVGVAGEHPLLDILRIVGFGILLILGTGLFIRYLADRLMQLVAKSPELLVTFAIAWAALFAAMADFMGFSMELGGLLAGVSLASTQYKDAISTRLGSLRDFLLLFFFIALGSQLDMSIVGSQIGPALLLSLFVLVGNPLIVLIIMGSMGYRKRTGFLAGLTVAQISEFSLIFVAMGYTLGHVNEAAVGLVTLVGLVTIAMSTYMILYSHNLYSWVERWLWVFERKLPQRELEDDNSDAIGADYDVVVFGLGRYGSVIYRRLTDAGKNVLGIDFDPDNVRKWQRQGHTAIYGDMSDPEFLASLPLTNVQWVISATPVVSMPLTHHDARIS